MKLKELSADKTEVIGSPSRADKGIGGEINTSAVESKEKIPNAFSLERLENNKLFCNYYSCTR